MARKFMQTFLVANGCKTLIDEGKTISIRQMFYMTKHTIKGSNENTFEDQNESDPIIEDLEVGIDALREELHLFANRRGLVVGKLVDRTTPATRSISSRLGRGGWGIPSICEPSAIKFVRNKAEFILLVEKQAIFHRLNEDNFWEKHNCILMTSDGQAARGARRLLQRLATELKLPIYVARRQRSVGSLHLLRPQAGLDQPRLRVDAHGGAGRALSRHERVRLQEVQADRRRSRSSSRKRTSRAPSR